VPGEVLGREAELEAAERFLDAVPLGLQAMVLEGAPGIGKTTLWHETAARAKARGYRVLTTRPAEAEARLSFSGLSDLVGPVEMSAFEALPVPQREALEIALARANGKAHRHALFAGFVSLLAGLATASPTVLAVDDLQWLDLPTSAALEFAMRRMADMRIGLLVAVRPAATGRPRSFERALEELPYERVHLGPLSIGVLHHLMKERLGQTLPRPTLVRVEQASSGNPFFALEIARELIARGGRREAGEALPVPPDLRDLVRARVRRLSAGARDALLAAAILAHPTIDLVGAVDLEEAEEAGFVVAGPDGRIRFSHPLYAAAVLALAGTRRRREMHRQMAGLVQEPEERARHLALAADGPDQEVAAVLSDAAVQALGRGAQDAAAELEELAIRLTPPDASEERLRREIALCTDVWSAGDIARARARLEQVLHGAPAGDLRSEGLAMLGVMRSYEGDVPGAIEDGETARSAARARLQPAYPHASLAFISQTVDMESVARHAHAAQALFDQRADPAGYSWALLWSAHADLQLGRGADRDAFERGSAIQGTVRPTAWKDSDIGTYWAIARDDLAAAHALATSTIERDRERGEETILGATWSLLGQIDLYRGRWSVAAEEADRGLDVADLTGRQPPASALHVKALVAAHRGQLGPARETAAAIDGSPSGPWTTVCRQAVLGFLELSEGNHAAADRAYAAADDALRAIGIEEPIRFRYQGDHIQAVVGVGDLDRADGLVERLAKRAHVFPHPWTLAIHARSHGHVLAARGELAQAHEALDESLVHHSSLEMPFELARTLLVKGEVHRRRREKRLAREALEQSLAIFDHLGAPLWTRHASSQLSRVRARTERHELTVTEQEVAALAAKGRTNREIASALFMSPKTVEKRLASVYDKFGIGSRAELGGRMAERDASSKP
jgi:DNA-binding CsgD family transcriptional regulator